MTDVVWRPVPGYEGRYDVSSDGRVRSHLSGNPRDLKLILGGNGYLRVSLSNHGRRDVREVHRLVALVFHGEGNECVRHLDGDKLNNAATNLRNGTHSQNSEDCVVHGGHFQARKTHCAQGHPFDEENTEYRRGQRNCRTCWRKWDREKQRRKYWRKKGIPAPDKPIMGEAVAT